MSPVLAGAAGRTVMGTTGTDSMPREKARTQGRTHPCDAGINKIPPYFCKSVNY